MMIWLVMALAFGHPSAPSQLSVSWSTPETVDVRWRVPRVRQRGEGVSPELVGCEPLGAGEVIEEEEALVNLQSYTCPSEPKVRLRGLTSGRPPVILDVTAFEAAPSAPVLLHGSEGPYPLKGGEVSTPQHPVWVGLWHLLVGVDHILLVVGLTLLITSPRRLLLALTSFTLGHSLTLAAVSLGWLSVPLWMAEVAIAGSVAAVGVALIDRESESWLVRAPGTLGLLVGLLHGVGFAGVFEESLTAGSQLLRTLLGFNIGLEIGQVLVVAVTYGAMSLLPKRDWTVGVGYGIGIVGMFWVFQRLLV